MQAVSLAWVEQLVGLQGRDAKDVLRAQDRDCVLVVEGGTPGGTAEVQESKRKHVGRCEEHIGCRDLRPPIERFPFMCVFDVDISKQRSEVVDCSNL